MVAETIHPACMCEGGGRGGEGEAGASWDLKMQLENGGADERVSRGQASERAVCVCEAVSVEMGDGSPPFQPRPPLPTAVCPPGRRRRLRLAITASPHLYRIWTLECIRKRCSMLTRDFFKTKKVF